MKKKNKHDNEIVRNKTAYFNYEILESVEAGIELKGTEVKSLREKRVSLDENFVTSIEGRLYLKNAHIAPYQYGNIHNHEERRDRLLLLHKNEIEKLRTTVKLKGYTLVALKMYFKKSWVKVLVGVCKGKKTHDKRQSIKEREHKRTIKDVT
jgi:SsrA-binding protein